jgi:hypothetical protein
MTASRIAYRAAMYAYPADYRQARGREILDTLAESGHRLSMRELAALVAAGARRRVLLPGTRAGTASGRWAAGCRLAALVLLLMTAAGGAYTVAFDLWYGRLAMTWPHADYHLYAVAVSDRALARLILTAALPLAGALAVCRSWIRLAALSPLVMAVLFLRGEIGLAAQNLQGFTPSQTWLQSASQIGDAVFLASPAVLLWAAWRAGDEPAERHSLAWLSVPLLLGGLSLAFWQTTLTFWSLGILTVSWFLLSRSAPRFGVAAFGVLLPTVVLVLPTALGSPLQFEYAVAVSVGAAVLAAASLASALVAGGGADDPAAASLD